MAAFSKSLADSVKPARVVVLPLSAWASDWHDRPSGEVAVGLRLLSEADTQTCMASAAREAREVYPEAPEDSPELVEAYNSALMRWAVARATCDPNDASKPWLDAAEDTIALALTPSGIRRLWDELERATLEESVTTREASDLDLVELAALLVAPDELEALPLAAARRLRRLAAHMLDTLRPEGTDDVDEAALG